MFEHGCTKCEKTFVSRSKLNHHNNQLHEERTCDECGKIFKKKNFARHLKVHTDTGFTCHICAKTFNRKDKLQEHVKRCHEEELYTCDICEKTFAEERYLKIHMDIHIGAPRIQCKYCSKDFSHENNLYHHVKKFHPLPKVIENSQGFIMLEKSPEKNPVQHPKPKQVFNFEMCDFKSQRKYNLKVHMKTSMKAHQRSRVGKESCPLSGVMEQRRNMQRS